MCGKSWLGAVGLGVLFATAGTANATTIDYSMLGDFTTSSLILSGVTVTGSADVNVEKTGGAGLGIVGGNFDREVDTSEFIEFFFNGGTAVNVHYDIGLATDINEDGQIDELNVEAFDSDGITLGNFDQPIVGSGDVSLLFGSEPIKSFRLTSPALDGFAVRQLSFEVVGPDPIPELICSGFMPPFDKPLSLKSKTKRAIPVDLVLTDAAGFTVTDLEVAASPVINVLFDGTVLADTVSELDDEALLPLGSANEDNLFRFDPESGQWIYNLGTRQFEAAGSYIVMVASGDTSEYMINSPGGACLQTFERMPSH